MSASSANLSAVTNFLFLLAVSAAVADVVLDDRSASLVEEEERSAEVNTPVSSSIFS